MHDALEPADDLLDIDLLDITARVQPALVIGPYGGDPLAAWWDGHWHYFADSEVARVAAHLSGESDLAGRRVTIERDGIVGWIDLRSGTGAPRRRALHVRHIDGVDHYRFDAEWIFRPATALQDCGR
jgi:hypothetical protein